jgi:hypothetical protein
VQERQQAKELFQTKSGEWTALAKSLSAETTANGAPHANGASRTFEPGMAEDKGRLLTAEDKQRIRAAIESAGSIEEIRKLQRALELGFVPVRAVRLGGLWLTRRTQSEKELAALKKGATGSAAEPAEDEMEID